jgi:hypothetical protein
MPYRPKPRLHGTLGDKTSAEFEEQDKIRNIARPSHQPCPSKPGNPTAKFTTQENRAALLAHEPLQNLGSGHRHDGNLTDGKKPVPRLLVPKTLLGKHKKQKGQDKDL